MAYRIIDTIEHRHSWTFRYPDLEQKYGELGEVQFVDAPAATPATSGGPPPAGDEAASGGDAAAAAPPASAPDDAALLEAFNDFKAAPTAAKLDALLAGVAAWRAAGGGGDKAAAVEKMATVLEQKGRAYVASKGG